MDIEAKEDERNGDNEAESVSSCSSPLSAVPSELSDIDSEHDDVPGGEVDDVRVDVSDTAREVDIPTPKGKESAAQRTPKGKGKKVIPAYLGSASSNLNGGEEAETPETLQPPSMSPALGPSTVQEVIPPLDIDQQIEFSPGYTGVHNTRSSRRRQPSVVPKSEALASDVPTPGQGQQSTRRSVRKIAQTRRPKAMSPTGALESPAQTVLKLSAGQLNHQHIGGPVSGQFAKASKAKKKGIGKGFAEIREFQEADGSWHLVPEDAANAAPTVAADDEIYFTQSGRAVKPHPSAALGSRETPTTSTRRSQSISRTDRPSQRVMSPLRPRAIFGKAKPPQSDQNRAKSTRASRRAESVQHSSETTGTQSGLTAIQTENAWVGSEPMPSAPLSSQAVMSNQRAEVRNGATPLAMQAEGTGQMDPLTISTSTTIEDRAEHAQYGHSRDSSTTKGKRASRNKISTDQLERPPRDPTAPLTGPSVVSSTVQPVNSHQPESSIVSQLQALRASQNTFATGLLQLEEQQSMIVELFTRNQTLLRNLKQESIAQAEMISKVEEQYTSEANLSLMPGQLPAKGVRRTPATAIQRTKEPTQKQGNKKRKAERQPEGDIDVLSMYA